MANMSYCRFQNTVEDLRDCEEYLDSNNLSESEDSARDRLIAICKRISDAYSKESQS